MASLPSDTTQIVLEMQQRLLMIIDQSTRLSFQILQHYGETQVSLTDLEQLDNVRTRADLYYSRFYTLLKRIAEAQPMAPVAMLELLGNAIEEAQGTISALAATLTEIQHDWDLS